jgi:transcriptional regulator with XRE-family HTH domain
MKERIQQIINLEQISPSKFADIIGVQRSSVSHILSGRNNPGLDFLSKILLHFPAISGDWLITGKGTMTKERVSKINQPSLFSDTLGQAPPVTNDVKHKPVENLTEPEAAASYNVEHEMPKASVVEQPSTKMPELPSVHVKGKTIERIVVFYNDQTFREYQPE